MKELWKLFIVFAKIGGFTFGGGLAMLPLLQKEVVESQHWATEEELMDYYAVGQCTPGIIAVNTATFIGYKQKGILGGIFATLGVITPSMFIITFIAICMQYFLEVEAVRHIFAGVRICVCVLIFNAVIKLVKKSVVNTATAVIFLGVFVLSFFTSISAGILVVGAGLVGFVLMKNKGGKVK